MITVRSVTEAMRHVRRGDGVEAKGVGGRVWVQLDEIERWACVFSSPRGVAVATNYNAEEVHDWLREFFPKVNCN